MSDQSSDFFLAPFLRPDRTLVWLPNGLVQRLGLQRGKQITTLQWNDREMVALLASREKANEAKQRCDADWHIKNG